MSNKYYVTTRIFKKPDGPLRNSPKLFVLIKQRIKFIKPDGSLEYTAFITKKTIRRRELASRKVSFSKIIQKHEVSTIMRTPVAKHLLQAEKDRHSVKSPIPDGVATNTETDDYENNCATKRKYGVGEHKQAAKEDQNVNVEGERAQKRRKFKYNYATQQRCLIPEVRQVTKEYRNVNVEGERCQKARKVKYNYAMKKKYGADELRQVAKEDQNVNVEGERAQEGRKTKKMGLSS